jgi:hypothetical protein
MEFPINTIKTKVVESDAVIRAKLKYKYKDIDKFREDNKVRCKNYYLNLSTDKREISRIKNSEYYSKIKDTPEFKQKRRELYIRQKAKLLLLN